MIKMRRTFLLAAVMPQITEVAFIQFHSAVVYHNLFECQEKFGFFAG